MENQKKQPGILGPEKGLCLAVAGGNYRILISGKDTGGAYASIEMIVPPGGGPGPHAHAGFEESFYVLEGEVEVMSESGRHIAGMGSFINIPKGGAVHGFKNKTGQMARLLCTVVPAGLEEFFQEIGQPVEFGKFLPPPAMDEASLKKLKVISEKYGQEIFPPDYLG